MKGVKIELTGILENETALLKLIREILNPRHEKVENNCTILMSEHYSLSTNSDLMMVIFIRFETKKTILEIISGGAAEGIFGFTFGSEKGVINKVLKPLKTFCLENNLIFNSGEIDI